MHFFSSSKGTRVGNAGRGSCLRRQGVGDIGGVIVVLVAESWIVMTLAFETLLQGMQG